MNSLARLYEDKDIDDQAKPFYVECFVKRKERLGDNHPDTLTSINGLALFYESQGKYDQAEPLYVECYAKSKE